MKKAPLNLDSIMHDLTVEFARDLQQLARPRRCRHCGSAVVAAKGKRKLAALGKRLERVLNGDISLEVRRGR